MWACDRSCRNGECAVREVWTAASGSQNVINVQTSLSIAIVDVVCRQEPVPLRTNIANLKLHIVGQLALDCEVVLRRVLVSHLRLKRPKQSNWTKHGPVHGLVPRWSQDTVDTRQRGQAEWVGIRESTALIFKRCIKQSVKWERASAEGRLCAELFEN